MNVDFALMVILTVTDGLCCIWSKYPICCCYSCKEIPTTFVDSAQLNKLHVKTEIIQSPESSFLKIETEHGYRA